MNKDNVPIMINKNIILEPQSCVKLLGVQIDNRLTFHDHISSLCKKAGQKLGAVARLSKNLQTDVKLLLSKSFVLCNFNYCSVVWHFCSVEDMKKIEKVQYQKNEMKCEVYLKQFKLLLSTWNGIPCMCSSCHLCVLSQM